MIEDELRSLNILDSVRKREYFISEIVCYYSKFINFLEIEYTNKKNFNKIKFCHSGKDSKLIVNFWF